MIAGKDADTRVSLGFVGDICLGKGVDSTIDTLGPDAIFGPARPLIDRCDLVIGNLECCVLDNEPTGRDRSGIYTTVAKAAVLPRSGMQIFSIANNHIMDFGLSGLSSTIDFLTAQGSRFFGAGTDLAMAEKPLFVDVKGRRLAFLGACDVSSIYATRSKPGTAPMRKKDLARRVRAARRNADLVIVVLHADFEFCRLPAPYRRRLSQNLIDTGAALVIQHHPHVCQGIEAYNGGLIAYSLGNFVFKIAGNPYQERRDGTRDSMLLQVDIDFSVDPPRISSEVHGFHIDRHHRPIPCDEGRAKTFVRQIEEMSRDLQDDKTMRKFWFGVCKAEFRRAVFSFYYTSVKENPIAALRGLIDRFRNRKSWHWVAGFLSRGYL